MQHCNRGFSTVCVLPRACECGYAQITHWLITLECRKDTVPLEVVSLSDVTVHGLFRKQRGLGKFHPAWPEVDGPSSKNVELQVQLYASASVIVRGLQKVTQ